MCGNIYVTRKDSFTALSRLCKQSSMVEAENMESAHGMNTFLFVTRTQLMFFTT